MALRNTDRRTIRSLARTHVVDTLGGMRRYIKDNRWLGKTNRYSLNPIAKIQLDNRAHSIKEPKHLSQYIAASSLLHATDGWSYLGRSLLSLLRGDPHRCRHLAYYAELRAAMSLLATEGIGVFKNRHFVISGPNSVSRLDCREGTHDFVSSCLEYWSIQRKSGQLFAEIVSPNGRSLFDWLLPIGGSAAVAAQVRQWLMQWGMDLKLFADDRDARNESSYRPDGIPEGWVLDVSSSLQFARDVWRVLEPAPNSPFDEIDRHILRLSLESTFKAQTGIDAAADFQKFSQFICPVLDHQVMSGGVKEAWQSFLVRQAVPSDAQIFASSRQSPDILETSHFAIISRATLLLRLASGATTKLFRDAGINGQSIEFWWQRLGQSRGIWEGTREMGDLVDLWADIDLLLTNIDVFQDDHAPGIQTFFLAGKHLQQASIGLGSCERVAIWSSVN